MTFSSHQPEYNKDANEAQNYPAPSSKSHPTRFEAAADASTNTATDEGRSAVAPDGVTVEVDLHLQPRKEPSLFRNRNFMLLWVAQALTQTAQNTLNLALVDYVTRLTNGSPTATAIATVAFVLPGVFFSALAGVFVDRFNKRYILIATNGLRALIVPWLVLMSGIPVGIAVPCIFLI